MSEATTKKSPLVRSLGLWLASAVIMALIFVFQTRTGPTYPLAGSVSLGDEVVEFELIRSENTGKDLEIRVTAAAPIEGTVTFKRYKSNDEWTSAPMSREGGDLVAALPWLDTAGKYQYYVYLSSGDTEVSLSGDQAVMARYKGEVPKFVLITHIAAMFIAILLAIRTALEAIMPHAKLRPYIYTTLAVVFVGGLVLGPIVQKYAFGAYWTGFPFGYDLTDNKTLIAFVGWAIAAVMDRVGTGRRGFAIFAALLMLGVYFIPHSVMGSERDYTEQESGITAPAE